MSLENFSSQVVVATFVKLLATLLVVATTEAVQVPASHRTLEGCQNTCGNVTIPYPFGIGKGCYYYNTTNDDIYYQIKCERNKHGIQQPILGNMELLDITLSEGELRIANFVSHICYSKNGTVITSRETGLDNRRFTLSPTKNVFVAIGCDTYAWFDGTRDKRSYHTGCMTVCDTMHDVMNDTCSGLGCCQTPIPSGITGITIQALSFKNHTNVSYFNPCGSAFVASKDAFTFRPVNLTRIPHKTQKLPVTLDWVIGTDNCSYAREMGNYLCGANSVCNDSMINGGYRCKCLPGFQGNPYLKNGCTDVDECAYEYLNQCKKPALCINSHGGYHCKCPNGFYGNGTKTDHCNPDDKSVSLAYKIVIGVGVGVVITIVLLSWLYCQHEKRQLRKARRHFFQQNGGHLLRQKLKGRDVSVDSVKLFTVEELEKATNKYSDNNIIGKGGFGVVYKGTLPNNQIIAIKKSLKVNTSQSEQFINEVIVLSQLNNRNVVRLLGCCLETEVPLLVYEFIDNGTLHEHLHDEAKASLLTWNVRLRIALEVAEVLSYLHTTISIPIIHRDMKSMNVLLDQSYTAKVSDFGASRLIQIEQDNLATMVLGTYGYLDPEYLQTGELTKMSDVYSFGVVLVELLTRQQAISNDRPDNERLLASIFLRKLTEERLHDILDDKITVGDDSVEQIKEVAKLAQRCLKLKGEERPCMIEVSHELRRIRGVVKGSHPWCRNDAVNQVEESAQLLRTGDSARSQIDNLLSSLEHGR